MFDTSNLINPVTGKTYTNEEIMEAINSNADARRAISLGERWGYEDGNRRGIITDVLNNYWNQKYQSSLNESPATSATTQAEAAPTAEAKFDKPTSGGTTDYNAVNKAVDTQQAIAESAQAAQSEAENNAAAAASAGVNKSRAGMLSDNAASSSNTSNVSNISMANSNQAASTQADYMQKMAQADALDQQAKNMKSGAMLTAIGGGIQGAAAGASTGAMISDENCKEEPFDDAKLYEAIRQFKELYMKVKELRGRK